MIRLVTTRSLVKLASDAIALEKSLDAALHRNTTLTAQLAAAQQAGALAVADRDEWKQRACKAIDQIALGAGTIAAPVMSPPAESRSSEQKRIFGILNRPERQRIPEPTDTASVLGVNDRAASEAVSGVF